MGWILMFVMHFLISLQTVSLGLFASGSSVIAVEALSLESRNSDSLRFLHVPRGVARKHLSSRDSVALVNDFRVLHFWK